MSNVDLTTRVLQLSAENQRLRDELTNLMERFRRLTPEGQAQAVPLDSMMIILMHTLKCVDFQIRQPEIERIPKDLVLVFGGGNDDQTVRIRLLPRGEGEKVVGGFVFN